MGCSFSGVSLLEVRATLSLFRGLFFKLVNSFYKQKMIRHVDPPSLSTTYERLITIAPIHC
jgi:hypothetical protein